MRPKHSHAKVRLKRIAKLEQALRLLKRDIDDYLEYNTANSLVKALAEGGRPKNVRASWVGGDSRLGQRNIETLVDSLHRAFDDFRTQQTLKAIGGDPPRPLEEKEARKEVRAWR